MPKDKFYDLQPGAGSHLLCENGVPIARFNELEKQKRSGRVIWPISPRSTNATWLLMPNPSKR